MWKQVKPFIQKNAGTRRLWCLQNVRKGFGIGAKYPTAWQAWEHTDKQYSSIPDGVDVPLYYSWKTDGHINVRLVNGKVWSDGKIYPNLTTFKVTHPTVRYQGWSASVNGVRVLKLVADPIKPNPKMPKVGSTIQLLPKDTRTTFKAGTTKVAGHIKVTGNDFLYIVRGYDKKYAGRIIINTKQGGGNGVALALYYTNGKKIEGWKQV